MVRPSTQLQLYGRRSWNALFLGGGKERRRSMFHRWILKDNLLRFRGKVEEKTFFLFIIYLQVYHNLVGRWDFVFFIINYFKLRLKKMNKFRVDNHELERM